MSSFLDWLWDTWVSFVKWSTIFLVTICLAYSLSAIFEGAFLSTHVIPLSHLFTNLGIVNTTIAFIFVPILFTLSIWVLYFMIIGAIIGTQIENFIKYIKGL
jgi:hypothetical protein